MPRRAETKAPEPLPGAQDVRLQFGHNTSVRQVVMLFGVQCDYLTFTPEQAEIVAEQLRTHATAARG